MVNEVARPTLQAVVRAAVEATGASRGWLLRREGDALVVAAVAGDLGHDLVGSAREQRGVAAYVMASGQPAALQLRPDDAANDGAGGAAGTPPCVLAAPCSVDEVLGVLELVDAPGGTFAFDDVETVTLLADIAGAALGESGAASAPPPARLAASLETLARADPDRYTAVARAIEALV